MAAIAVAATLVAERPEPAFPRRARPLTHPVSNQVLPGRVFRLLWLARGHQHRPGPIPAPRHLMEWLARLSAQAVLPRRPAPIPADRVPALRRWRLAGQGARPIRLPAPSQAHRGPVCRQVGPSAQAVLPRRPVPIPAHQVRALRRGRLSERVALPVRRQEPIPALPAREVRRVLASVRAAAARRPVPVRAAVPEVPDPAASEVRRTWSSHWPDRRMQGAGCMAVAEAETGRPAETDRRAVD